VPAYPLEPDRVTEVEKERDILIAGGLLGREQRRGRAGGGNPRRKWTLFHDHVSLSDMQTLVQFFINRGGRWQSFEFTDPSTSTTYNVRFDTDKLDVDKVLGRDESPRFSIRVPIREVL
jgi:hypothetical protein